MPKSLDQKCLHPLLVFRCMLFWFPLTLAKAEANSYYGILVTRGQHYPIFLFGTLIMGFVFVSTA